MSLFSFLFKFASSDKIKVTHKGAIAIIVFTTTILLDSYLGISYHLKIKNKLDQIESVNNLLYSQKLDSESREYVLGIRDAIIRKKSIVDYFLGDAGDFNSRRTITSIAPNNPKITEPILNDFVFYLTKWLLFIIVGLAFFFVTIFDKKSKLSLSDRFGTGLFYLFFILLIGFICSKLLDFVPVIHLKKFIFNYYINLVAQFLVILVVGKLYFLAIRNDQERRIYHLQNEMAVLKKKTFTG